MALIAGAGNPVGGSNPTGVGQGLNYIRASTGEVHAYAYSGIVTSVGTGSANTVALSFTTGGSYLVGTFTYTNDEQNGTTQHVELSFNGAAVYSEVWDHDGASTPLARPVEIIVPPFTIVEAKFGVNADSNDTTHLIVGRIYE